MDINEAKKIAYDSIGSHAITTLDLAERVLADARPQGRDFDCYRQLADLKARLQRIALRAEHESDIARIADGI